MNNGSKSQFVCYLICRFGKNIYLFYLHNFCLEFAITAMNFVEKLGLPLQLFTYWILFLNLFVLYKKKHFVLYKKGLNYQPISVKLKKAACCVFDVRIKREFLYTYV